MKRFWRLRQQIWQEWTSVFTVVFVLSPQAMLCKGHFRALSRLAESWSFGLDAYRSRSQSGALVLIMIASETVPSYRVLEACSFLIANDLRLGVERTGPRPSCSLLRSFLCFFPPNIDWLQRTWARLLRPRFSQRMPLPRRTSTISNLALADQVQEEQQASSKQLQRIL